MGWKWFALSFTGHQPGAHDGQRLPVRRGGPYPLGQPTAGLAALAGVWHGLRLARWAGYRTTGEPLVLVLHVGYAFVPIGFLLLTLAIVAPNLVVASGALHAWTVGAIGTMTLAVMTRATLGHAGKALIASRSTQLIYVAIVIAALARVLTAFEFWRESCKTCF